VHDLDSLAIVADLLFADTDPAAATVEGPFRMGAQER
jgi:hypothetical protein